VKSGAAPFLAAAEVLDAGSETDDDEVTRSGSASSSSTHGGGQQTWRHTAQRFVAVGPKLAREMDATGRSPGPAPGHSDNHGAHLLSATRPSSPTCWCPACRPLRYRGGPVPAEPPTA
jgi:hypothetical protein